MTHSRERQTSRGGGGQRGLTWLEALFGALAWLALATTAEPGSDQADSAEPSSSQEDGAGASVDRRTEPERSTFLKRFGITWTFRAEHTVGGLRER